MRAAAKLEEWRAAGLIDGATVAAITAHEEGHRRPIALLAVAGLGVLALALGILSVVAANWDDVPASIKLAVHLAATVAAATAAYRWARRGPVWAGEASLFLLSGLIVAGIALHAQVYQQVGQLWQALAWWAVLTAPALLLLGRTRITAALLGATLIALASTAVMDDAGWLAETLSAALPPALVLAALALPDDDRRSTFADGLLQLGLTLALVGASLAQIAWTSSLSAGDAGWVWHRAPVGLLFVAGACLLAFRRLPRGDATLVMTVLLGAAIAILLATGIPHGGGTAARFAGLIVFASLWGGVAAVALRAGWSRLFGVAVVALAARLFLVYVELFYSLALTGAGLIVGGLLLIGLTWGSTRIVRRAGR